MATLLVASVVIFIVLDVLPGSAADVMLGETATPEAKAALSAKLGLDRPPLQRYGAWMKASSGSLRRFSSADSSEFGCRASCLRATVSFWALKGSTACAEL